ncbi:MAG: ankyrin repeat domain-containing protein, partial [Pseudomonadota bacterium]
KPIKNDNHRLNFTILQPLTTVSSIRKNYNNFAANKFISNLQEKFINSISNPKALTLGHMAALENDTFFIGKLIAYKIIPNFPDIFDKDGETPLHSASKAGNTKIIYLLLNSHVETISDFINQEDTNGKTALHHAAFDNKIDIASRLIKKGADIKVVDTNGLKPIHIALMRKLTPMVKFLQSEGADINELVDGYPLVALAYKMKNTQLVNYLVNQKIDLSVSYDETTFIHTICNDKNSKLLRKIAQKYDIYTEQKSAIDEDSVIINIFDQEDGLGRTPFDIACSQKSYSTMKILARCDVDVDHMISGNTALHTACAAGDLKTARVLLNLGANPAILNSNGLDCCEIAESTDNVRLLELVSLSMPVEIIEIIIEVEVPLDATKEPIDIVGAGFPYIVVEA